MKQVTLLNPEVFKEFLKEHEKDLNEKLNDTHRFVNSNLTTKLGDSEIEEILIQVSKAEMTLIEIKSILSQLESSRVVPEMKDSHKEIFKSIETHEAFSTDSYRNKFNLNDKGE